MSDKVKSYNRNYLHFDRHKNYENWIKKVEDEKWVKSHGFYPFVHFKIKTIKYNWCPVKQKKDKQPKIRSIKYAAHIDRFIYKHYSEKLNESYNCYMDKRKMNEISTAYRSNMEGKGNIHFAKDVFEFLATQRNAYVFLGDFTSFFDRLDHRYLKKMLLKVLSKSKLSDGEYAVYKNITKYSWINLEDVAHALSIKSEKINQIKSNRLLPIKHLRKMKLKHMRKNPHNFGIPQGSPISAVYSNVYMVDFDEMMKEYVKRHRGLYKRYSDDFVLIIPVEKISQSVEHRLIINDLIKKIPQLKLSKEKVEEYHWDAISTFKLKKIDENQSATMNYLGFSFDGALVRIRDKSLFKFYNRAYKKVEIVNKHLGKMSWRKHKRDLLDRYTYLGDVPSGKYKNSNFLTYARRAANIFDSSKILQNDIVSQVENHWKYINRRLK